MNPPLCLPPPALYCAPPDASDPGSTTASRAPHGNSGNDFATPASVYGPPANPRSGSESPRLNYPTTKSNRSDKRQET